MPGFPQNSSKYPISTSKAPILALFRPIRRKILEFPPSIPSPGILKPTPLAGREKLPPGRDFFPHPGREIEVLATYARRPVKALSTIRGREIFSSGGTGSGPMGGEHRWPALRFPAQGAEKNPARGVTFHGPPGGRF